MSNPIRINGNVLHVTPVSELTFPQNMVAAIISSRIMDAVDGGDPSGIGEDVADIATICIDEPVRSETIQNLPADDLGTILSAMYPEMGEGGDE